MDYLKLTSAIILGFTSPILSPLLVGANPQNPESVEIAQVNFKQPPPHPDVPPGTVRGTGSRGNCPIAASGQGLGISLTPLIPAEGWGKTASESPTVWVYVSYNNGAGETPITGEISLEEIGTNRRLPPGKVSISLPTQSGAFPITFTSSLEPNKWYRWYLVVDCSNPEDGPTPSFSSVEGLIYPEAISPLPATPQDRLQFYAEDGFWYDAINEAGNIYCSQQPNRANLADWESLLKYGELLNEVNPKSLICPTE
ncbi:MAG TPA: DUF928 domain-containing protein [Oscillatoriaceae cyanobacterium M33_DOE_052]|uniref:DUF928 domain-containing protein n=1 Tax=Planktothricoides sp. SpSt-374 TaxID=2282167 RepID=A0A7C3VTI3_9CYAN|nr:DUF928 domain-containing protein [Oscillatoriaceae cyanobacterium M33_DOE_052]